MISLASSAILWVSKLREELALGENSLDRSCFNEIYGDLADLVGIDVTLQIYAEFAGQQVSFPKKLFSKDYVVKEAIRCYDGKNLSKLSKRFGYSERHLRYLIKQRLEEDEKKEK